jgi:hypothetical protein
MNCKDATKSYEAWLAKQTSIIKDDLAFKHQQMSADAFSFMRATFYRWVELWPELCPDLAKAPAVLAVGDLHIQNFGAWRDQEGRLVWGINDFDEAFHLPCTHDLVRLAVSTQLSISAGEMDIKPADACEAILEGYTTGLNDGGLPFVLAEQHQWLRSVVTSNLHEPEKFWETLDQNCRSAGAVPSKVKQALAASLPEPTLKCNFLHRRAGLGSLGRPRFVAVAEWHGAKIAREAKPLLRSACVWAGSQDISPQYEKVMRAAVRCPDPVMTIDGGWLVRRLAPDTSRIHTVKLPTGGDMHRLLQSMGKETANIHLGSREMIAKVKEAVSRKPRDWLHDAAKKMTDATIEDWDNWRH